MRGQLTSNDFQGDPESGHSSYLKWKIACRNIHGRFLWVRPGSSTYHSVHIPWLKFSPMAISNCREAREYRLAECLGRRGGHGFWLTGSNLCHRGQSKIVSLAWHIHAILLY